MQRSRRRTQSLFQRVCCGGQGWLCSSSMVIFMPSSFWLRCSFIPNGLNIQICLFRSSEQFIKYYYLTLCLPWFGATQPYIYISPRFRAASVLGAASICCSTERVWENAGSWGLSPALSRSPLWFLVERNSQTSSTLKMY